MIVPLTIGRIEKGDRGAGKQIKETASFGMGSLVLASQLATTFAERFLRNDGNYSF
jgi:hypothetical protein